MESTNINRIIKGLNSSGQRLYETGVDLDGGVPMRRDGVDQELFGQFAPGQVDKDTEISGISANKGQKRIPAVGHLDSAANVAAASKEAAFHPKDAPIVTPIQAPAGGSASIQERTK